MQTGVCSGWQTHTHAGVWLAVLMPPVLSLTLLLRWRHEGLWQTRDRELWAGECVCGWGAGGGVPGAAGGGGVQRGGGCSFGQLWAVVAVSAAAEVEARGADVGHRAVGW
mgnify:CR=1 FL=1